MKFKTVVRMPEEEEKPVEFIFKLLMAFFLLWDVVINTIFPFLIGYFFAITKNLIFLTVLIFMIFFNIKIRLTKDGEIDIKIIRTI